MNTKLNTITMKQLLIIIIAITLFSCNKKEETPQEKQTKIAKEVKGELNYNFDKIILLANIENLPKKKVHKVMQGYFKVMYNDDIAFEKDEDYQDMINTILKILVYLLKRYLLSYLLMCMK